MEWTPHTADYSYNSGTDWFQDQQLERGASRDEVAACEGSGLKCFASQYALQLFLKRKDQIHFSVCTPVIWVLV